MNQADVLLRQKEFRRLALSMGVQPRDIEDLVQEALEKIWANRHQIDPSGNVLAWMYEIARNVVRKYLRHRRSHPEELIPFEEHEGISDDGPDPEATALLHARIKVLRHLISQIPAPRRVIFVEHVLLEMPLAEIAASHGLSPATVSKRLSVAAEEIRIAAARWQEGQRWRGGNLEPAFVLLLGAVDLRARVSRCLGAVRRLDALRMVIVGAVVVTLGAIPSAPWPPYPRSEPVQSGLSSPPRPPRVVEPPPERHDAPPASAEDDIPAPPPGEGGEGLPDGRPVPPSVAAAEEPERSAERDAESGAIRYTEPHGTAQPATYSSFEDELVGRAGAALDAGNVVKAREWLEEHARNFPNGQLAPERDALLKARALH